MERSKALVALLKRYKYTEATLVSVSFVTAGHCMKQCHHIYTVPCEAGHCTVYPFDVSYSAGHACPASVRALYKTNRNQCGFGVIAAAAAAQTC